MTDIYNRYINNNEHYSVIAFINTNESILIKDLFFLKFKLGDKYKENFYLSDDNLKNLYLDYKRTGFINDKNLSDIYFGRKHFSYVKIIEDIQNPQLEGKVIIFSYGAKIKNIIDRYLSYHDSFKNTFKLLKITTNGFPNFEDSFFTSEELELNDFTLDINSELKYRKYTPLKDERREKLQKLSQIIK